MKISLIDFSVENFRIFKERVNFSMFARKSKHTFQSNGENLLKTSLIYGPNASGKTTLLQAFKFIRNAVLKSQNNKEGAFLPYQKFELSSKNDQPISFEIIFSIKKKILKYRFSFLNNHITSEKLSEVLSTGQEAIYFERTAQNIKVFNLFEESKDVITKTRSNVLFLSATAQWNNKFAMQIVSGFNNINVISGTDKDYRQFTIDLIKKKDYAKGKILEFMKMADFCIDEAFVEKINIPDFLRNQIMTMGAKQVPEEADTVFFGHGHFNSKGKKIGTVKFNIAEESIGTQSFFDMLGPIIDTLEGGKVLLIDEFDNSLHPYLTKLIIQLFESKNPNNAQLIVTTHDTSLLAPKELNKEQFWFTEKDKFGAAKLFSLAEFKPERNDSDFSKKYLSGRFGALPFIGI